MISHKMQRVVFALEAAVLISNSFQSPELLFLLFSVMERKRGLGWIK